MDSGRHGHCLDCRWCVAQRLFARLEPWNTLSELTTPTDFVMTIPLGFVAEKYGQRTVLWMNLIPRVFMLAWVVAVGYFEHIFPPRTIIAGPFLSILGGDCVFNSMTYALAASITDDYVLRYVPGFVNDQ